MVYAPPESQQDVIIRFAISGGGLQCCGSTLGPCVCVRGGGVVCTLTKCHMRPLVARGVPPVSGSWLDGRSFLRHAKM